MPHSPGRGPTVIRLPLTPSLELRLEALIGFNPGDPGYLLIEHRRRSPGSTDPDDFHRVGAGVRLRRDRIPQFIEALLDLEQRAMSAGVWAPRGGRHG